MKWLPLAFNTLFEAWGSEHIYMSLPLKNKRATEKAKRVNKNRNAQKRKKTNTPRKNYTRNGVA